MKRLGACLLGLILAGGAPGLTAWADTILHLSETGQVTVQADRLVAALRVEAVAAAPAEAQKQVNTAMAQALAAAHAVAGLKISTSAYSVWQAPRPGPVSPATPPARPEWHAGQTLTLSGPDAPALLALAGRLQAQGLALNQLAWQVAPEAAKAAHAEATRLALVGLRARAEAAATALGLKFDSFRDVHLDAGPMPRDGAVLMGARAMSAPPPAAEPEESTVRASVSGEAILK